MDTQEMIGSDYKGSFLFDEYYSRKNKFFSFFPPFL